MLSASIVVQSASLACRPPDSRHVGLIVRFDFSHWPRAKRATLSYKQTRYECNRDRKGMRIAIDGARILHCARVAGHDASYGRRRRPPQRSARDRRPATGEQSRRASEGWVCAVDRESHNCAQRQPSINIAIRTLWNLLRAPSLGMVFLSICADCVALSGFNLFVVGWFRLLPSSASTMGFAGPPFKPVQLYKKQEPECLRAFLQMSRQNRGRDRF